MSRTQAKKNSTQLCFHLHSFCILQKPVDLVTLDCVLDVSRGFLTPDHSFPDATDSQQACSLIRSVE